MSRLRALACVAMLLLGLLSYGCNGIAPLGNQKGASPTATPTGATPTPAAAHNLWVTNNGDDTVSVFTQDTATGNLTLVQTAATDHQPFGIAVHPSLDDLYVANSGGGTVQAFTLNPNNQGQLTFASRVTVPTARSVAVVPNGQFLLATGNGQLQCFSLSSGLPSATPISTATGGQNPNVVTVNPSGAAVYVTNLDSGDISVYGIDGSGTLSVLQASVAAGGTPQFVAVTPNGKFAYVTDEVSENIVQYSIDSTGKLTAVATTSLVSGGPTGLSVTPDGKFLIAALATAAAVETFSIDATSGALAAVQTTGGGNLAFQLLIDASGAFAYTANQSDDDILEFSLNNGTLTLSQTINAGITPTGIAAR